MEHVTVAQAKEHLEELIDRVRHGADVRIGDGSGPAIRLVVAEPQPRRIVFGQWKHLGDISEERLLEPLDTDELTHAGAIRPNGAIAPYGCAP